MIRPERLTEGASLRCVSPASGMWARSELWRGIEGLEALGFRVQSGKHAYDNRNYLAGKDEDRAQDIMDAFCDPDVDAVICSQGGYGCARLFRHLDFGAIAANPKPFIGYSDITSLHLMFNTLAGLMTFHGPNAAGFERSYLSDYTKAAWKKALMAEEPLGQIPMASPDSYLLKVAGGVAEGPLIGGNLSLLCASLGTPYEIVTKGKILFFEELDTEPWIMDHLLTQLANAGKLKDAAGIAIGECTNCEPLKHEPGFANQCSFEDLLFELLVPLGIPVIYGLPFGHTKDKATLPLGRPARIDAESGTIEILS